jgi:hypothetical protein
VGILARLIARREPAVPLAMNLKAGLGAFLAILLLGVLFDRTSLPFLLAPFGASAILLFGRPEGVLRSRSTSSPAMQSRRWWRSPPPSSFPACSGRRRPRSGSRWC